MASIDEARTYMEDADDDGNPIDDTKTYVSTAPSIKEEANVSRTRKESLRRKDSSSPAAANLHTDSDSTAHQRSPLKRESKRPKEKSRDKDRPSNRKTVTHGPRPGPKSVKTAPNIHTSSLRKPPQDKSSFYGVSPTGTSPILMAANSNSTRPRAYTASQRPQSYYMHPPMPPQANTRYYQHAHPAPGTSYPPISPFLPPSAPPLYPSAFPPPSPFVPPPQGDYFSSNLSSRFGPYRPPTTITRPAITYGPGYDEQEEGGALVRQASLTRRRSTRQHEDRVRMAPPLARPNTTRPPATSGFAPPSKRRSIESLRDDESLDETEYLYNDGTPPEQYEYRPHPVRRPSIDSTVYDMGPRFAEIAGRQSRRNSHYEGRDHSTERDVEEKYREALRYQQDLAEGPIDPLTTDSLRRLTKTPSGGTKSSGSRDESGYGRSAATTRTSVDNDDITILVKNAGQLSLGNALLDFQGAEIIVRTGNSGGGGTSGGSDRHSRGGSDNISSAYDDRRTRFERPSIRGRANSQAGSHSRGFPFQPQQQPQSQPSPQVDYSGNPYFPTQYPPPYPYPYQY
ncbi:hypothetical protein VPNG_05545 [Cytospora leucostoma]|uniref:Uncharacterized protein n=1 Tax=Cytospora leucostoma TaxID=1230097 RepID=A0A423X7U2_9PEZI|nr:hypothetical protein VPNG_05545 [Cytospora leucostoma]